METDRSLWRGRSLITKMDNFGRFKVMTGKHSILFVPVTVEKYSIYEVIINCKSESGNGKFMCNFYANRNYDFEQKSFECPNRWSNITFNLAVEDFPKSLPVNFRIWRPDNATGNLTIKNIDITNISTQKESPSPRFSSNSSHSVNISEKIIEKRKTENLPSSKYIVLNDEKGSKEKSHFSIPINKDIIQNKDITIVINTLDRKEKLEKAINSIISSSPRHSVEIIINDLGSNSFVENIQNVIYFSKEKTNFPETFNESLKISSGKLIMWLSDDMEIQEDGISVMCEFMDNASKFDLGGFMVKAPWNDTYKIKKTYNKFSPLVGCMYTETLRMLGGLNEDYPYRLYQQELNYRIMRNGGKIFKIPAKILYNYENDELYLENYKFYNDFYMENKFMFSLQKKIVSKTLFPKILIITKNNKHYIIKRIKEKFKKSTIIINKNKIEDNFDIIIKTKKGKDFNVIYPLYSYDFLGVNCD